MKRTPLLNRHLSRLVAELGHLDRIVVADAGLPVPEGTPVIDLAVTAGVPSLFDVLGALQTELVVEEVFWATEAAPDLAGRLTDTFDAWADDQEAAIGRGLLSHTAFKDDTARARAVIRTGEVTPYANVILVSGVAF